MGTKIFDLFFSRKGGLNPNQYFWPRIFVVIVISMVLYDAAEAYKTNRLILGYPYKWLSAALYFICMYSVYALDSKRLKDMGRKTGFALAAIILVLARPFMPYLTVPFGIILFIYYFWLITTPSKPAVEFMGTKITYGKMDRLLKEYGNVMEERDKLGHEKFKERVLETADETIAEAKRILATKTLSVDERELLTLLVENAEKAKTTLDEEEDNEKE